MRGLVRDERARYLVAGGSSQLLYLAVFALASAWFGARHYMAAFAVAQVVTFSYAFVVYRFVVFRSQGSVRGDLVRFMAVWAGAIALGAVVLPTLVEVVGLQPFVGQLLTLCLLAVVGFVAHRYISFRHRDEEAAAPQRAPFR